MYCSKETKTIFGTKANMFRVMVSNLPVLANNSNVKLSNPESKGIEQKISEIELIVVGKLDEIDQKVSYSLKKQM